MEARNQVGIGLSYRPASQCSLATQFQTRFLELIPRPIAGLKFSTLISVFECFSSFPPFQYSFLALLTYFLPPFNLSSCPFQPFFHSPFIHSFAPFQPSLHTPFSFSSFYCLQYFSSLPVNISSCPCQSYLLTLSAFLPPLQTFLPTLPLFPYNHSFI